jgi:hypothetical protein
LLPISNTSNATSIKSLHTIDYTLPCIRAPAFKLLEGYHMDSTWHRELLHKGNLALP